MDGFVATAPTAMQAAIPKLGAPSRDEIAATLKRDGCAIVEGAVSQATIARVRAELGPWFKRAPKGEGAFFGRATKRLGGVFAKAPASAELALAPEILAAAERILLADGAGDCIQLHLTQAIEIGPGEAAQLLHRDDDMFPFAKSGEVMLNVMWPLDPFTADNGATRLAPGSQHWPREPVVLSDEGVFDALASPSDAIIWLGSLVHGGGANLSAAPRRGLVISYSLAWLAQAEKLLLSVPPDVARGLPEKLQRLIGYQIHRPNLGWIEGRDPKLWLDGETGAVAAAADNLTPAQQDMLDALLAHLGREP